MLTSFVGCCTLVEFKSRATLCLNLVSEWILLQFILPDSTPVDISTDKRSLHGNATACCGRVNTISTLTFIRVANFWGHKEYLRVFLDNNFIVRIRYLFQPNTPSTQLLLRRLPACHSHLPLYRSLEASVSSPGEVAINGFLNEEHWIAPICSMAGGAIIMQIVPVSHTLLASTAIDF